MIATSEYANAALAQLRSPASDASAVAAVLGDPSIGGFDVEVALNQPSASLSARIDTFFSDRGRDDLLLLYVSCHGLKDDNGELYFAATDTDVERLVTTAISASLLNRLMDRSRSRGIILVLDCCYSGAFARGMRAKAGPGIDLGDQLAGNYRVVITATSAMEYAFEGDELTVSGESASGSYFTRFFVEGLATGDADLDIDGIVTVDELFRYISERMASISQQRPQMWSFGGPGLIIGRSAKRPKPAEESSVSRLQPGVLDALRSTEVAERLKALSALEIAVANADEVTVAAARRAVGSMLEDDSRKVREAAAAILADPGDAIEPGSSQVAPAPEDVEADRLYEAEAIIASDYWTVTDELGYAPYADAIAEFLQHGDTKPPLTIGIKAPWGAGKTSLMRMVQDRLDPPVVAGRATAADRRQSIGLAPESRTRILGVAHARRWRFSSRATDARDITYGRLLRRLSQQSEGVPAAPTQQPRRSAPPGDDLKLESPPVETWRPTVWFNPWMYQSGEQVWAGLANEVISQLTDRMSTLDREAFWLELNLRRVDPDAVRRRVHHMLIGRLLPLLLIFGVVLVGSVGLALVALLAPHARTVLGQVMTSLFASGLLGALVVSGFRTARFLGERVTGPLTELLRQPDYAAGWDKLAKEGLTGSTSDLLRDPRYETKLGFLYLVQTDMRRVLGLIATPQRPVVVFVDDLDRCSPGVVSQVIEAINLFLAGQFPNCVFVIAMEPEMVAAHVEVAYQPLVAALAEHDYWGDSGTLGWKFLDKIIQLPLTLPALRSELADNFLGVSLSTPGREAPRQANIPLDEARVAEIERSIQQQAPTLESISQAASVAQERVAGTSSDQPYFAPETKEAIRRELKRRLRPEDPEVQEIVKGVAGRLSRNPREIKRFVNVFRFYAVIRQEREAAGLAVPDNLAEVAKLAVLAVRWPHLRSALGRQVGKTDRDTLLSMLEAPLRELPDDADPATRISALKKALDNELLPQTLCTEVAASEDLCRFLSAPPTIGTAAPGYL